MSPRRALRSQRGHSQVTSGSLVTHRRWGYLRALFRDSVRRVVKPTTYTHSGIIFGSCRQQKNTPGKISNSKRNYGAPGNRRYPNCFASWKTYPYIIAVMGRLYLSKRQNSSSRCSAIGLGIIILIRLQPALSRLLFLFLILKERQSKFSNCCRLEGVLAVTQETNSWNSKSL